MLRSAYLNANAFESLESPFLSETIVSRVADRRADVDSETDLQNTASETDGSEALVNPADVLLTSEPELGGDGSAGEVVETLDFIERLEPEQYEPPSRSAPASEADFETAWSDESGSVSVGDGFIPHGPAPPAAGDETMEVAASEELEVEHDSPQEPGEQGEILGTDERVRVGDTLAVPNRWICALDIWEANPRFGTATNQPKEIVKARGTGILVGPRHVLTALHVVHGFTGTSSGTIKRITVTAARNGDNTSHPFGLRKVVTVHRSQSYPAGPGVRQPDGSIVRASRRDDYALLVLDKDLAGATHKNVKGSLGFWGENPAVATIKVLTDGVLHGTDARVTGYPGDTCGSTILTRTSTPIDRLIANCMARRADEWASRQWRATGTLDAQNHPRLLYHTADTYQGQSGSPICVTIDRIPHLVGIHTDKDTPQRNQGERVTTRMLTEIAGWINLDPAVATASIQNDTLVVRRPAAAGKAAEMEQSDDAEV